MKRSLLVAAVIIFSCVSFCYALETPTHMAINEYIARNSLNGFSLNSYLKDELGIKGGVEERFASQRVWWWLRLGGLREDAWAKICPRSANHYHNPLTDQGFSGVWGVGLLCSGESSIQWSQEPIGTQSPGGHYSWYDVRDYFYRAITGTDKTTREKNFADTFRGLGQLMHLVHDSSVPEHVRNDGHYLPAYEGWVGRAENVLIDSEEGVILIRDTVIPPVFFASASLGNPSPLASVPVANLFDTDQYTIGTNPGVTLNNNIGLSEYTNANFLSPDTMFTSEFPYPSVEDCVINEDNDRQYLKSDGNGEKVDHLAVASRLYFWRIRYFPQIREHLPVGLDSVCYEEYASKLLLRAVGYSAGLLDYFFRGKLEAEFVDEGLNIANKSEETMHDGHFELYYDNADGERKNISILSGAEVTALDPDADQTITFDPPSDFGEDKHYILVYTGGLGNETYAVVGKVKPCVHELVYIYVSAVRPDGIHYPENCFVWNPATNSYAEIEDHWGNPISFPCRTYELWDWIGATRSVGQRLYDSVPAGETGYLRPTCPALTASELSANNGWGELYNKVEYSEDACGGYCGNFDALQTGHMAARKGRTPGGYVMETLFGAYNLTSRTSAGGNSCLRTILDWEYHRWGCGGGSKWCCGEMEHPGDQNYYTEHTAVHEWSAYCPLGTFTGIEQHIDQWHSGVDTDDTLYGYVFPLRHTYGVRALFAKHTMVQFYGGQLEKQRRSVTGIGIWRGSPEIFFSQLYVTDYYTILSRERIEMLMAACDYYSNADEIDPTTQNRNHSFESAIDTLISNFYSINNIPAGEVVSEGLRIEVNIREYK